MSDPNSIKASSSMREVVEAWPGAQRALFRQYHIGGCSQCAFRPEESLEEVCRRNGNLDPSAVLDHLRASHEQDAAVLLSPLELREWREREPSLRVVDVRSREEFEALHLPGSVLLSQQVMREILSDGTNTRPLVLVDHQGKLSLDAAAYFMGHGLTAVRCLRGGLDAWAREADPDFPRYRLDPSPAAPSQPGS